MQPFRQFQQGGSIVAGCSGKHHGKARHEKGRAHRGPSVRVGYFSGAQIRKALFQIPIHCGRKVTVVAATSSRCWLNVHTRSHGFGKRVESCEVTGITPTQPRKTLFAQAGASRPRSVVQARATCIVGQRDQQSLE